jgi:hypothetical protein
MKPNARYQACAKLFGSDLSPCCRATVYHGICCECGQPCLRPLYLLSPAPISDDVAREKENIFRNAFPVGAEAVILVAPGKDK